MTKLFERPLNEQNKANLLRLADAMLKGAAMRPQVAGVLFQYCYTEDSPPNTDPEIGSCAFGAAWEGSHPRFHPEKWFGSIRVGLTDIVFHFGLDKLPRVCDPTDHPSAPVAVLHKVVIHLNDAHQWSREEIAEWLRMLSQDG